MLLWTFMYKFFCGHIFSVLLSIYLQLEILSCMVTPFLTFWGIAQLFSTAAAPFYSNQHCMRVPISPHFHHLLMSVFWIIVILVGRGISLWFWFSSWGLMMLGIFLCAYGSFIHHLWRNVNSSLLFLNWVILSFLLLSYKFLKYILDTCPLSEMWFANIFPNYVDCHSTFFVMYFEAQVFNFDEVQFSGFFIGCFRCHM